MKGSEEYLYNFMEGRRKRFVIPVYQRNYNWKKEQCKQLFDDLVALNRNGKSSHFFGSIVSVNENSKEFTIIDGQQRLTTVSLIMIAMIKSVENGVFNSEGDKKICDNIKQDYIVAVDDDVNKLRLRPYNDDKDAFSRIVFDTEDKYNEASNVTVNFRYFYDRLVNDREISLSDLIDAIEKLQIISIELKPDQGDDPQLIFESLNSTGLALTESDKIRNYILMGLKPDEQERLYRNYWYQIERLSKEKLDDFIFNFLLISSGQKVKMSDIYKDFKIFAKGKDSEVLLSEMKHYAEIFAKLRNHDLGDGKANRIKERIDRLGQTVADPFFMSYMDLYIEKQFSAEELRKMLTLVESYMFRRIICGEPSNALRNMFASLHRRVLKLQANTEYSYSSVLTYLLENMQTVFPDDTKFSSNFGEKDIYHLRSNIRSYILDRLERKENAETINVFDRLEGVNLPDNEKPFSVEHIMPQTLSEAWIAELGGDPITAAAIHKKWIHTIANLTVTAYNSELSNAAFSKKKEMVFNVGGIQLNDYIRSQSSWGEEQLKNRQKILVKEALEIWAYPQTDYVPSLPLAQQVTLDDEDFNFKGKKLRSVILLGEEYKLSNMEWSKAILWVYKQFFELDPQPLFDMAADTKELYIVDKPDDVNTKISDGVYVYLNNDTNTKIRVLRRVAEKYSLNSGYTNDDIVFVMKSSDNDIDV